MTLPEWLLAESWSRPDSNLEHKHGGGNPMEPRWDFFRTNFSTRGREIFGGNPMDFLGTFSSASSKGILFILNKVKYRGDKNVNKRESQVGLGEHEEGGEAQVAANIFVQLFWELIFVRIIFA